MALKLGDDVTTWPDRGGQGNDLSSSGSIAAAACVPPKLADWTDPWGETRRVVRFGDNGDLSCLQGPGVVSTQTAGIEVWAKVRQPAGQSLVVQAIAVGINCGRQSRSADLCESSESPSVARGI